MIKVCGSGSNFDGTTAVSTCCDPWDYPHETLSKFGPSWGPVHCKASCHPVEKGTMEMKKVWFFSILVLLMDEIQPGTYCHVQPGQNQN